MDERQHEELRELLGAYVLAAVDPLEHRRVEKHIATCDDCAREVRLLSEPATELAWLEQPDPDAGELVERITRSLPWRARRSVIRATAAIAAVALIAAGFLGFSLRREQTRNDRIVAIVANADLAQRLDPQAGFDGRGRLYIDGDDAVLFLEDVPDAGGGRAYQLWALQGGKPASMAVVEGEGDVEQLFEWNGDADGYAVTIEPAGGSPVPTSDPVLISS